MIKDCEIIKVLFEGGQKLVYLAEHKEFGKLVIKKGKIHSYTFLERIKREVTFLKTLDSPYYPKQHHFNFNIDMTSDEFEIIEDYIEGAPLRQKMDEFNSLDKILKLLYELINGLSVIWGKNIVHRDLKPENIIIRPDGTPCIIDLGIARFLELESLTNDFAPIGPCTPAYAAPEQLANYKHLIDPRTDFFSLGVIALELYLGKHPFDKQNKYSIAENIMRNEYIVETDLVKPNDVLTKLANNTLQTQSYERFRNSKMFIEFIKEYM